MSRQYTLIILFFSRNNALTVLQLAPLFADLSKRVTQRPIAQIVIRYSFYVSEYIKNSTMAILQFLLAVHSTLCYMSYSVLFTQSYTLQPPLTRAIASGLGKRSP